MRSLLYLLSLSLFLTSCVSSKIHKDLQSKYQNLQEKNTALRATRDSLQAQLMEVEQAQQQQAQQLAQIRQEEQEKSQELSRMMEKYQALNQSYEGLLQNNNELLASNQRENEKLMKRLARLQRELALKEDSLRGEQQELTQLRSRLEEREKRVNELENLIAQKDSTMLAVRSKMEDALLNFDGKGLSVKMKDGKVYVSLENSLLFPSGSWQVQPEGRKALSQLAEVLAQNPDLRVMVEGHTDSDDYYGGQVIKDNWDLSVMRATSVVKQLTRNDSVNKQNLIAAGRSEYLPIAPNETSEGKAQNRRIEIIITPDLSELSKLLAQTR